MQTTASQLISFDSQGDAKNARQRVNDAVEKVQSSAGEQGLTELGSIDLGELTELQQQAALLLKVVTQVAELYNLESKKADNGDLELKGHKVSKEGVELVERAAEKFHALTKAGAKAFESQEILNDFGAFVESSIPVVKVDPSELRVAAPRETDDRYKVIEADLSNALSDASGIKAWQIDGRDAKSVKEHNGKVRDNYTLDNNTFVSVTTDKISASNIPNLAEIPYKGQILNAVSNHWAALAKEVGKKYGIGLQTKEESNDPNLTIAHNVTTLPVEVVLRRHLTGTAYARYEGDKNVLTNRVFGDHKLPEGIKKHQRLDEVIVDPTTKGKDDASVTDAQAQVLVGRDDWQKVRDFSREFFKAAEKEAAKAGIILADTKLEFGRLSNGDIVLIDEVLTPDSSRYWFGGNDEGSFNWAVKNGDVPKGYDKDPMRYWIKEQGTGVQANDLQGHVPKELVLSIANRYVEIHDLITGTKFEPEKSGIDRLKANLQKLGYLKAA